MIFKFIIRNIWLILVPLGLLVLAYLNFFTLNDNKYTGAVLIMPIFVGMALGGLIQVLVKQKSQLKELNTQLQTTNQALLNQQIETKKTIHRMQRIQVGSLIAIGAIHDIRNILTPIMMGIGLISPTDDSDKQTLLDMDTSANRCLELTNKILNTLEHSDFSPTAYSIEEIIPLVWKRVQSLLPEKINVQISIQPKELQIELDDLMQVLHNLALNAYNVRGSGLKLQINGTEDNHHYCLEVSDNGPGLPQHIIEKIGQVNIHTENNEIHGIGLAVVYSLLQRNNIQLEINSRSTGTTFRMLMQSPPAVSPQANRLV